MRVTFNSGFAQATADIARAARQLSDRQREVSSGRRMHTASDDPSAAAGSVRERTELAALDRYAGAAESAASRLTVIDTVLADVIERLSGGRTAILGARNSSATDQQREAAASELAGVRDALASDFNSKFRGAYLFSGTAVLQAPYVRQPDGSMSAYGGDAGVVQIDIDRETTVELSLSADAVARGAEIDSVFVHLERAIVAVRAGDDAGMTAAADGLARTFDRAVAAQSRTGAAMNVIVTQQGRLSALSQASNSRIAAYESANMAEAISKMNQAETAYRAALGAVSKASQSSLMDYLK